MLIIDRDCFGHGKHCATSVMGELYSNTAFISQCYVSMRRFRISRFRMKSTTNISVLLFAGGGWGDGGVGGVAFCFCFIRHNRCDCCSALTGPRGLREDRLSALRLSGGGKRIVNHTADTLGDGTKSTSLLF